MADKVEVPEFTLKDITVNLIKTAKGSNYETILDNLEKFQGKKLDMLATWRERASDVRGRGLDCGHFLPEEKPEEVASELLGFLETVADGSGLEQ